MSRQDKIEEEVLEWNSKFPLDVWWRKKYNIPFMSSQHKEITFIDQLFDYTENKLINKRQNYTPNQGDFLKKKPISIESAKEEFEKEFLNGDD